MKDFEEEVRKLVPEDGDIIVIRAAKRLSREQAENIQRVMASVLDRVGKKAVAIVLDDGLTVELLKTSVLRDAVVAA